MDKVEKRLLPTIHLCARTVEIRRNNMGGNANKAKRLAGIQTFTGFTGEGDKPRTTRLAVVLRLIPCSHALLPFLNAQCAPTANSILARHMARKATPARSQPTPFHRWAPQQLYFFSIPSSFCPGLPDLPPPLVTFLPLLFLPCPSFPLLLLVAFVPLPFLPWPAFPSLPCPSFPLLLLVAFLPLLFLPWPAFLSSSSRGFLPEYISAFN